MVARVFGWLLGCSLVVNEVTRVGGLLRIYGRLLGFLSGR